MLYFDPGKNVEEGPLKNMRDTISYRGPDDAGVYINKNIGLGVRRLSIIDLPGGAQPILNEDDSMCVVYNGELYNYLKLREDLIARGHVFRTRSDTEVILHAYEEFGKDCLERFRGMFAFAIWDNKKNELFIARDRLGVKPLYYAETSDSLLFGSEIKVILQQIRPEFNKSVLPEYLANRFVAGEETFFKGIKKLLPGHYLTYSDDACNIVEYWDIGLEKSPAIGSIDAAVKEFYELFNESVRLRLMSDVPLGVFLSGGVDSSAITAAMSKMVKGSVKSFSVGFKEKGVDESGYARAAADNFGTDHHEVIVSSKMFFDKLPELTWHEDEPIAFSSSVPLYFVSLLAAEKVKVVLTGEGSDELLAGYAKYRISVYNIMMGRLYKIITTPFLRNRIRAIIDGLGAGSRLKHLLKRTFLYLGPGIDEIYFDNFSVFTRAMQGGLLNKDNCPEFAGTDPHAVAKKYFEKNPDRNLLDRFLYTDIKTYLERLLMKQDKMSMAASIESRVPFLDHKLVEFVFDLPVKLKLCGWKNKYILKKAMGKELPRSVLGRRKMGFPVPIKEWLRSDGVEQAEELLLGGRAVARGLFNKEYVVKMLNEHKNGLRDHSERLWLLLSLETWHRVFIDGEMAWKQST